MSKFNQHFNNSNCPKSSDSVHDYMLAKFIWNAAINESAKMVEEQFDECEPWIHPEDIRGLKIV